MIMNILMDPRAKPLYDFLSSGARKFLGWPLFQMGKVAVTPIFLIKCGVFLVALSLLSSLSKRFLAHRILSHTKIERGRQYAMVRAFGYLIFLFGLIVGLDSTGLNLRSLLVVGGALGVGIGFGLQNVVANFVAGLVILWERPVQVSDLIDVGGTVGEVVRIGARGTWVQTFDNEVIIVPNSDFINNKVTNWTANDRTIRISIPVGVAYGSDLEQVRDLLEAVGRNNAEVLREPPPMAVVRSFGDSSINFVLRVSTNALDHPWKFQSDLMIEIAKVFRQHKIEIPFPQRDIHLLAADPAPKLAGSPAGAEAKRP